MIPVFLRKENIVKEKNELTIVLERYKKQFGKRISLDWLSLSDEEWVEVLKECISQNKSYEELFGKTEYDEDADY